jgi:tripartite-type tricarboxylate transporter receptor subunit TctC
MGVCTTRNLLAASIAVAMSAGLTPASAQGTAADFYKGKQIQLIIPSTPGGGYDLYGRLLARHIGKFIPGNPNILPSNMPGAAGVVTAQNVYATGVQDGTVLGLFYTIAIMDPLLNNRTSARYDPLKFQYIGSANSETFICYVRTTSGVKRFADAMQREVILGASGSGGYSTDYPAMYNNFLATKFKVVGGYPGINEIGLAIENGEVDGTCGSSWSVMTTGRPHWLKDGVMTVLAQENVKLHPDVAKLGVPLTLSFAKTPQQREVMEFIFAQSTFGRPFAVGPGVPADRVAILRQAFSRTMRDPEFLADAEKMKLEITDPLDGAEVQAAVAKLMATPPEIVAAAKQAVIPRRP